jgi:uncharacterized membrane protein
VDEIRGLCVLLMVFFHAFFVGGFLFDVSLFAMLFEFFEPVQPFFAGIFVFICGLSCRLSHNNLKRGLLLAGTAILLSAAMWTAVYWRLVSNDSLIWFGVLHCLASCILLYVLFLPTLRFFPPWLGILLNTLLFILCWHLPFAKGGYLGIAGVFEWHLPIAAVDTPWLYPFGLCPVSPCADYFPLLPWFFCFLAGTYTGIWAKKGKFPKSFYRKRFSAFSFIGRHALIIYLLHQPLVYLLFFALDYAVSLFS